jgi:glycosyltransferase involved in cell wall biosynthesis
MQPYGGTEIQLDYLRKYSQQALYDRVQITTSVPEKEPLHPLRPNILWIKNSYDQPNIAPWFKEKKNHSKYDWYVFNSHWTYEKFRYFFNVPDTRSLVIKNGIDYDELKLKTDFTFKLPLKLIYFSTPWRGLDVLLEAMELIEKEKDIELDVYSSTIIYGAAFKEQNDKKFVALYDKARKLKNVTYKDYCSHPALMARLKNYHINVHPSTFEETFCISAMESLAAGCMLITTDLGAIPETCTEFPIYVPYTANKKYLAHQIAASIVDAKGLFQQKDMKDHLQFQQQYYYRFYNWKSIAGFWDRFLKGTLNARHAEREEEEKRQATK